MNLTRKTLLLLTATILVMQAIIASYELRNLQEKFELDHRLAHNIILANLTSNLNSALYNVDINRIQSQVKSAFSFGEIKEILVFDDRGQIVAAYRQSKDSIPKPTNRKRREKLAQELQSIDLTKPIMPFDPNVAATIRELDSTSKQVTQLAATAWFAEDDLKQFVGHVFIRYGQTGVQKAKQDALIERLKSQIAVASILILLLFMFLRKSIIVRLIQLTVAIEKIKNRQYDVQISRSGSDEIARLSGAFIDMTAVIRSYQSNLEEKVRSRTSELQASRDKIKRVFDTVDIGIMSFNQDYLLASEFSRKTSEIIDVPEGEIAGADVRDLLFQRFNLSLDQKDRFMSSLESAWNEPLFNWEVNLSNFPSEVELSTVNGHKHLSLFWTPLIDYETETVQGVLLEMRDLTEQKRREKNQMMEHNRLERSTRLVRIANGYGIPWLQHFLRKAKSDMSEAIESNEAARQHWLIELHTLKGEARTLGFDDVSAEIHQAETALKQQDQQQFIEHIRSAAGLVQEYTEVFQELFGNTTETINTFIQLSSKMHQSCLRRILPINRHFHSFTIKDEVGIWVDDILDQVIGPCLIHAMNNAIDHGYLQAESRYGQERSIKLSLHAYLDQKDIVIELSDKGYGVDPELVLQRAHQLKLNVDGLSPEDIIFLPEFSTAKGVSETSGRGVGMSAIQKIVNIVGGSVKMTSQFGSGSLLVLRLPQALNQPAPELDEIAKVI